MDTNFLTYSEDLYTRLNSTLWKVRGGLWFNLWGSYFVPGTKIDQWNYWGGGGGGLLCQELLAMYKSRNAPFICPFILRNRNLRNSRNVFSQHLQASFIQAPPPSFLHSVGFVYIFIWIFLTSPRIYSAFSLQNGRVTTTLSQRALTKRIAPC